MILTITTTHEPATDLGYLLHKNPDRHQTAELSFGTAHVVYPEATPQRCSAALIVDVDPVALVRNRKGPEPGIKCRGREYLRIIYGPEYTAERHLSRLRSRVLGHKRSLAQREFALGIDALERFVAAEPLYRVHECVFGVLALESAPVDPRF
jgi:hypothetical protein